MFIKLQGSIFIGELECTHVNINNCLEFRTTTSYYTDKTIAGGTAKNHPSTTIKFKPHKIHPECMLDVSDAIRAHKEEISIGSIKGERAKQVLKRPGPIEVNL